MKEVLHYTFSKKAAAIQKMQLLLNHREDSLTLSVEGNSTLLSALDLFVKDENSNILFHRQLGTCYYNNEQCKKSIDWFYTM